MTNRMRVQFQDSRDNNFSLAVEEGLGPDKSVTVAQICELLDKLLERMPTDPQARWIPSRLHGRFRLMVAEVKRKVSKAKEFGGFSGVGGNARPFQERYRDNRDGVTYRVDVENDRGHNLRA
jgi:hypothetical protein